MKDNHFPNFDYEAEDISRFAQSDTIFSLLLKADNTVIHYEANRKDVARFMEWLNSNNIPNAKASILENETSRGNKK